MPRTGPMAMVFSKIKEESEIRTSNRSSQRGHVEYFAESEGFGADFLSSQKLLAVILLQKKSIM